MNPKIEILDPRDRTEVVEVLGDAFSRHPMLPMDATGQKARGLAAALLDAFGDAPDARLFGIRQDGRLVCIAFVFDASYEPGGFQLLQLLFRMLRNIGWGMTRKFTQVLAEAIPGEERRLELLILGTRADSQRLGLGRAMMNHVVEFARSKGYQSVSLEVAKETPAFAFYLHEGFQVEKEVPMPTMPLCLVRKML